MENRKSSSLHFSLITSALHSPQGRTYDRTRALGRLYGITFLPGGRFEEQLCCDENENDNADAGCASDATAEALASRRSAACSPNENWAAELLVNHRNAMG